MLIFRFIIFIFWVTTRINLHVLVLKKTTSFLILSSSAALYFPSVWNALLLSLPNTQSPLIGPFTHAWPSTAYNKTAAMLNQFLHALLATRRKLCYCVTWWRAAMLQHFRKVTLLKRRFRSSVFCGWEDLQLVGSLSFLTCARTRTHHWWKGEKNN